MTTPDQRTRAVIDTESFLTGLASGDTKRIPAAVRKEAHRLLRHYPSPGIMDQVAKKDDDWFASPHQHSGGR